MELLEIQQHFEDWVSSGKVIGGVAAAFDCNGLTEVVETGVHSRGGTERFKLDHLLYWGSCSKPLTSLAAVMLADRGQLSLNSHLSDCFPEVSFRDSEWADQTSLKDLLCHRSGLIQGGAPVDGPSDKPELTRYVREELSRFPVERADVEHFSYSNAGYTVVGEALQRETHRSFRSLMEGDIFSKLGLPSCRYGLEDEDPLELVGLHMMPVGLSTGRGFNRQGAATLGPGAGVIGSARDLAGLAHFLMCKGSDFLEEMLGEATPTYSETDAYCGLGLLFETIASETFVGHHGEFGNHELKFLFSIDRKIGIVFCYSFADVESNFDVLCTREKLIDAFFGVQHEDKVTQIAGCAGSDNTSDLSVFAGNFARRFELRTATVECTSDLMTLTWNGVRIPLTRVSDRRFVGDLPSGRGDLPWSSSPFWFRPSRTVSVGFPPSHSGGYPLAMINGKPYLRRN